MDITGMWKISEVKVFGKDFKQSWKATADILADESISPMQKVFAQSSYKFEEDGTALSLMPKAIVPAGEGEAYGDEYVIAKKTQWKEENGKLFIAAEENGEADWQEMTPAGEGFEVFGYQRIVKA